MRNELNAAWLRGREPVLFAVVAGANSVVYVLVAIVLAQVVGVAPVIASGIAYGAAIIVAFLGNSIFTFEQGRWNSPRQWIAHTVLYGSGLAWNMAAVFLFERLTGNPVYGFVVFFFTWPAVTFYVSKTYVFRA
jgi:putative flippase GtrA